MEQKRGQSLFRLNSCHQLRGLINIFQVSKAGESRHDSTNSWADQQNVAQCLKVRYCMLKEPAQSVCIFSAKPTSIGHFGRYHNTLCLSPQILHKHRFQFLLELTMVPRENKKNAYATFGGIFQSGLFHGNIRFSSQRKLPHGNIGFSSQWKLPALK